MQAVSSVLLKKCLDFGSSGVFPIGVQCILRLHPMKLC